MRESLFRSEKRREPLPGTGHGGSVVNTDGIVHIRNSLRSRDTPLFSGYPPLQNELNFEAVASVHGASILRCRPKMSGARLRQAQRSLVERWISRGLENGGTGREPALDIDTDIDRRRTLSPGANIAIGVVLAGVRETGSRRALNTIDDTRRLLRNAIRVVDAEADRRRHFLFR